MSSEDINSFPDHFFIPKENNNFFHSFTEEEDEHFEPFSNNFLIDESFKEKIGSIDGKSHYFLKWSIKIQCLLQVKFVI